MNCPKCGLTYFTDSCPACGKKERRPWYLLVLGGVLAVGGVLASIAAGLRDSREQQDEQERALKEKARAMTGQSEQPQVNPDTIDAGFAAAQEGLESALGIVPPNAEALAKTSVTLAQAIAEIPKEEAVLSARFKMDKERRLSLSLYTAEKGLGVEAVRNRMKKWTGDPTAQKWIPNATVLRGDDLAPAVAQFKALVKAKSTLADILSAAEAEGTWTIFSIRPVLSGESAMFVVGAAAEDGNVELVYDATTGRKVPSEK